MGLGGALFEAIDLKMARSKSAFLQLPRSAFCGHPSIDVVLIDRHDLRPAGAGETPIIGIAPAIGNAIFAASGTRLRSMPLAPRGLKA